MKTYFGSIQKHSFEINNLLDNKNIYMVFDENTLEYLNAFERIITKNFKYLVIPSGEENKTLDNVNKIWGFLKSALAIAILCFWPPENLIPLLPTKVLVLSLKL